MVNWAFAAIGSEHTEEDAEREAEEEAKAGAKERPGEIRRNDARHGRTGRGNGLAEITVRECLEVVAVLSEQRLVGIEREERCGLVGRVLVGETVLRDQGVDVDVDRVAGHEPDQEERQGRDEINGEGGFQ